MIEAIDPNIAGPVREARDMWGRLRRSELVDAAIEKAQNAASGFENGLRVQFRQILNNPRALRGFGPDEIAAMQGVVRGTVAGNMLRQVGKLGLGIGSQSNALGAVLGAGAGGALGGGVGAVVVPAIGTISKALANRTTRRASDLVRALTENGGAPAANQLSGPNREVIEALMRQFSMGAQPMVSP